ncbi:MAG TPA: glutamate-5-semialdehyde dehydrogenase [Clostridia bacterium]|nr:glutamate-5-semialdehyde dehydrogenase [Clostridia bacterium]
MKKAQLASDAAWILSQVDSNLKNMALTQMAADLEDNVEYILKANQKDMEQGKKLGLSTALLDRLLLNEARIKSMAQGLREVAALPDPVGEILGMERRPNGLEIGKMRVPLGVIGIIYEARPNVTVDAAGLCLKAGNADILRGGSEAINSNSALAEIISRACIRLGLPEGTIQLIETTDREAVNIMLKLNQYIDVIIPRGGAGLIQTVVQNSTIPVIQTGVGNCHTYVDSEADLDMALNIAYNAKVHRPGVCNAMETLLVHRDLAERFLPAFAEKLKQAQVEIRGCQETCRLIPEAKRASQEDWSTEYLDLILAVKIVESYEEALEHIRLYGTKHSEAIVTNNYQKALRFLKEVDAAAVYVNASTRFTDGYEFGLGAEIGISTQKLHARGPMGLAELTTTKYIILGSGQIRK